MTSQTLELHTKIQALVLTLLVSHSLSLTSDGVLLLTFKYSILIDPLGVLDNWNVLDQNPCSWQGVTCGDFPPVMAKSLYQENSTSSLLRVTTLSLPNRQLLGSIPADVDMIQYLRHVDLSNNSINGSLPANFSGNNLHYFNVSCNRISGEIPPEFASHTPSDAVIDLSFNNITGQIPEVSLFSNQDQKSYEGNSELCGKPLNNLCPNSDSPTAIAAFPKPNDYSQANNSSGPAPSRLSKNGLRPATIVVIVIGDVVGVMIVAVITFYVYKFKKNRSIVPSKGVVSEAYETKEYDWSPCLEEEPRGTRVWACLKKQASHDEESSDSASSDQEIKDHKKAMQAQHDNKKNGALVTVDGEKELEIETLLKASAYILGATGSSIMYKAVLEDGTTMAVRRIGENGGERFRDFQNQVRAIAKLVHPNLVRIRGFYWGADEKLVIHDFVPNGSLANVRCRKAGSSPCQLPWEVRLKIARGVARGLTYIHEKKHVHGNLKPSNILLGLDMEPKIGDFGLEGLVTGESGYRSSSSARNFGSKRSTTSRDSFQDNQVGLSPSPSSVTVSPYYAPESLRSLKPNPKWDVFSFGVILLELLTGKVIFPDELGLGPNGPAGEEKNWVLRIADVAIRADLEGREDALLALLKLGFSCLSHAPHKRPNMKETLQLLEKFPSCLSTSSFYY